MTISVMIWAFKTIQIYNILYFRKENNKTHTFNRKNNYMKTRQIFNQSAL